MVLIKARIGILSAILSWNGEYWLFQNINVYLNLESVILGTPVEFYWNFNLIFTPYDSKGNRFSGGFIVKQITDHISECVHRTMIDGNDQITLADTSL
jgi:hypothetical protein